MNQAFVNLMYNFCHSIHKQLRYLWMVMVILLSPHILAVARYNPTLEVPLHCSGIEIDFFGSKATDDDFISTNEFDFMDGRIRCTNLPLGGLSVILKANQMRFAKLNTAEDFLYADRDANHKFTLTYEFIEINIAQQGEWYYFMLHVDKAQLESIINDEIISLEVQEKSTHTLLFQKDMEVVATKLVLYRGLHDSPSQSQPLRAINARQGIVVPIGWDNDGHCNFAAHVISGENKDIYTSWTLNPHQAIRFIFGYNVGTGILLKRKFERNQTIPNEQYYKHLKEHLVIGPIEGASIKIVESQKNLEINLKNMVRFLAIINLVFFLFTATSVLGQNWPSKSIDASCFIMAGCDQCITDDPMFDKTRLDLTRSYVKDIAYYTAHVEGQPVLNESSINKWHTTLYGELCIKKTDENKQINFEGYNANGIKIFKGSTATFYLKGEVGVGDKIRFPVVNMISLNPTITISKGHFLAPTMVNYDDKILFDIVVKWNGYPEPISNMRIIEIWDISTNKVFAVFTELGEPDLEGAYTIHVNKKASGLGYGEHKLMAKINMELNTYWSGQSIDYILEDLEIVSPKDGDKISPGLTTIQLRRHTLEPVDIEIEYEFYGAGEGNPITSGNTMIFATPDIEPSSMLLFDKPGNYEIIATMVSADPLKSGKIWSSSAFSVVSPNTQRIGNDSSLSSLQIYPNPAKSALNIKLVSDYDQMVSVDLHDNMGRKRLSKTEQLYSGINTIILPLHGLTNGLYNVKVSGHEISKNGTVIVEQ